MSQLKLPNPATALHGFMAHLHQPAEGNYVVPRNTESQNSHQSAVVCCTMSLYRVSKKSGIGVQGSGVKNQSLYCQYSIGFCSVFNNVYSYACVDVLVLHVVPNFQALGTCTLRFYIFKYLTLKLFWTLL